MRLSRRSLVSLHCAFLLSVLAAQAQPTPLQLAVSTETAPPGGTVQIKIWASSPKPIVSGRLFMYFDPAIFDKIAQVAVFSAAGDAAGFYAVQNNAIDLSFTSPSGGVGRLRDLPVFAVTASLRADAVLGAQVRLSLDPSPEPWNDAQGHAYSVQVTPAMETVGGTLAIANVTPGGGLLSAGTVVRIDATGFDPASTLSIDGVSVDSVQITGPHQLNVILGAPAELTGKRIRLRNPDGAQTDYFPAFRAIPDPTTENLLVGGGIIFPLRTISVVSPASPISSSFAVQNPTLSPIDVTFDGFSFGRWVGRTTFTIAPGTVLAKTISSNKSDLVNISSELLAPYR